MVAAASSSEIDAAAARSVFERLSTEPDDDNRADAALAPGQAFIPRHFVTMALHRLGYFPAERQIDAFLERISAEGVRGSSHAAPSGKKPAQRPLRQRGGVEAVVGEMRRDACSVSVTWDVFLQLCGALECGAPPFAAAAPSRKQLEAMLSLLRVRIDPSRDSDEEGGTDGNGNESGAAPDDRWLTRAELAAALGVGAGDEDGGSLTPADLDALLLAVDKHTATSVPARGPRAAKCGHSGARIGDLLDFLAASVEGAAAARHERVRARQAAEAAQRAVEDEARVEARRAAVAAERSVMREEERGRIELERVEREAISAATSVNAREVADLRAQQEAREAPQIELRNSTSCCAVS